MARRLPNLNQLRAFEAAARRHSFKEAAEELNVTHAAISHQIKGLESALDQKLFHRRTRRVEPTPAAMTFAASLGEAFDLIASATANLGEVRMEGELRITCAPFYGNRMILPRLAAFHAAFPGIRIRPEMDSTVVDFGKAGIDAGIRYGAGGWPGLDQILLHTDELIPVAAPAMLEDHKVPLAPKDIAQMTLGYVQGQDDRWPKWFEKVGYSGPMPHTYLRYGNRARVVDLAFSGHGAALADRRLVGEDIASGRLLELHPIPIETPEAMYVVYPRSSHPDPRVIAFAEWFRNSLGA